MKRALEIFRIGVKEPFKGQAYIIFFIASLVMTFILFTIIPVLTVPGNSIPAQLAIFTSRDYVLLSFLSLLYALFITMQVYTMRQRKRMRNAGVALGGGAGTLFAGIAGTAFCASCLAPFLAFFGIGFGGVIFVLQYRLYLVAAITILMLFAIYLTARKINKVCSSC
ncbi:MAG: hypothetical protein HYW00_00175 [Candidatus Colwellbacteria bacterium]|nr:hypothetical protein [Candidatus Colwellbacteria bacterium]